MRKMMLHLRVYVLTLLVGGVISLNHENFLEGNVTGNDVSGKIIVEVPGDFYEFFTPRPPIPPPPSKRPTDSPTESPVIQPTGPPVKAGRFPSPVSTIGATKVPAPVPAGRWPQQPIVSPTHKPVLAPNKFKGHPPTFIPHPDPTGQPEESPATVAPVADDKPKVATRTATYNAEWGSDVSNCQLVLPNVFFNCHEGGVIGIKETENAECTMVGNDRVQCTQTDVESYSSIEFTCSGIRKVHLMSTATIGPNFATDCIRDGNVLKYLTLNRECDGYVDTNPTCNGGIPWRQDEISYCASPATCTDTYTCSQLKLEPLSMSNTNKDLDCSIQDPSLDLQYHEFDETYLSSLSLVEWRVSGEKRGCLWKPSPLLIRCEGGGQLEFLEDYPFCSLIPEENMGKCESFAPYSTESEESVGLLVGCRAKSEGQLSLSVEVPSENKDVECNPQGTIIQSVMLSRGCGYFGTKEFTLISHPSFCTAEEQVFQVDDNQAHCFVGNTCVSESGCSTLELPHLTADTGSGPLEQCTYIV